MRKRIISLCLAVCMMCGSLWGCSGTGQPDETGSTKKNQEETVSQTDNGPKGRYVESTISIPLEDGEQVSDIIQTEENVLELYTIKDKTAFRYQWTGENWEKQDDSLLEGVTFPYDMLHMVYGEDGNRYVVYPDGEDYKTYMRKLAEGQEPQALLEDVFSVVNDRGYYDVRPDFAAVAQDGSILLSVNQETRVYSPKGELLFSMPQEVSSMEWKTAGLLDGKQYITLGNRAYLLYDISHASATAAGEIPCQSTATQDIYAPMASDGSGGIYIANPGGIHHMSQGGTLWETVADGNLNSLSLPSAYIKKLFLGANDDFYVWMSQSEVDEIKYYTYDSQMPSVPSNTLTVYGLDLEKLDTIRQAASMFQLKHPEMRVELIDGQAESGSATVSDTIRTLNTELLAGNGADILVLDGLPVDSYVEKGVLENLKGLLEPMMSSGELMSSVSAPYTREDGSIYQIPSRMILYTVSGEQAAIDSLSTMESMRRYQSDPSHLPLRAKTIYENLTRQILSFYYEEIVDSQTGRPRPGKIKEMLETVKVLGEACGAKVSFDESEDGGRGYVYNIIPGMDGLLNSEFDRLDREMSALSIDKIKGLYDTILPLAVQKKHGYRMESLNGAYEPVGTLGINQASPRKELAGEFLLFLLGAEVQSSDLSDGLPVNTQAVDAWIDMESQGSIGVSGDDDYMLSGEWPSKEECQTLFDVAAQADKPVRTDRVLMEIIINETKGYFDGSLSLEQAAQNAQNKADLYFSE